MLESNMYKIYIMRKCATEKFLFFMTTREGVSQNTGFGGQAASGLDNLCISHLNPPGQQIEIKALQIKCLKNADDFSEAGQSGLHRQSGEAV